MKNNQAEFTRADCPNSIFTWIRISSPLTRIGAPPAGRNLCGWTSLLYFNLSLYNFAWLRSVQIFELTGNSEKMNISEVNNSLENIPLPPDRKKAILQLIDAKINNDMKEVIAKLNELEGKLEVKIQMTNDNLSNEIKIVYWVIGITMAVIMFVVARK